MRATIAIDRSVVAQDSTAAVLVYVINDGPDTVPAANPDSYGCFDAFVVTDSVGRAVNRYGRLCSLIGYLDVKLPPHDSIEVHGFWSPRTPNMQGVSTPLPPGRYSITADVGINKREVTSKPLPIDVVPP
ncbi:MAG TPA: hypothetical protein VHB25_03985 [Gemmatimonadaceae bacterium]|nr:hypothetical protein [Gemmatimonadaceae bacterium]